MHPVQKRTVEHSSSVVSGARTSAMENEQFGGKFGWVYELVIEKERPYMAFLHVVHISQAEHERSGSGRLSERERSGEGQNLPLKIRSTIKPLEVKKTQNRF